MSFSHNFDPTVLREYDIRGIVGRTLHAADAFAIGRCFGTMVARARAAGPHAVAVGYDGRLSSPELEAALVEGLTASGMTVLRIGRGPTPMLYYTAATRQTGGAVMVTGSHNPPDYNGFKMTLGGKPFFGRQILALGRWPRRATSCDRPLGSGNRWMSPRTMSRACWPTTTARGHSEGGVGQRQRRGGRGAGEADCGAARHAHGAVSGHRRALPQSPPRSDRAGEPAQLIAEVRARRADLGIAFDGDADRIGLVDDRGKSCSAIN